MGCPNSKQKHNNEDHVSSEYTVRLSDQPSNQPYVDTEGDQSKERTDDGVMVVTAQSKGKVMKPGHAAKLESKEEKREKSKYKHKKYTEFSNIDYPNEAAKPVSDNQFQNETRNLATKHGLNKNKPTNKQNDRTSSKERQEPARSRDEEPKTRPNKKTAHGRSEKKTSATTKDQHDIKSCEHEEAVAQEKNDDKGTTCSKEGSDERNVHETNEERKKTGTEGQVKENSGHDAELVQGNNDGMPKIGAKAGLNQNVHGKSTGKTHAAKEISDKRAGEDKREISNKSRDDELETDAKSGPNEKTADEGKEEQTSATTKDQRDTTPCGHELAVTQAKNDDKGKTCSKEGPTGQKVYETDEERKQKGTEGQVKEISGHEAELVQGEVIAEKEKEKEARKLRDALHVMKKKYDELKLEMKSVTERADKQMKNNESNVQNDKAVAKLEKEVTKLNFDKKKLTQDLKNKIKEMDNLQAEKKTEYDNLKQQKEDLVREKDLALAKTSKKVKDLEKEKDELLLSKVQNNEKNAELNGRKKLEQYLKNKIKEMDNLQAEMKTEYENLKQEKENLVREKDLALAKRSKRVKNLEKEKEELLLRLSAMAGRRLTDNNTNIADLSDMNRPTKLSEKYSELYDNEWTDAFAYMQELDQYKYETEIIAALLKILTTSYRLALKTADGQLEALRDILNDSSGYTVDTTDLMKQLKDFRKRAILPNKKLIEEFQYEVQKEHTQIPASAFDAGHLKIYVDKCLQLSWLMVIQDPPVYLHCEDCKRGDPFDKYSYREYTQAGPFVAYTVWPAVFLQKGDALLCKGVVQCDKRVLSGSLRLPTSKHDKTASERKSMSLKFHSGQAGLMSLQKLNLEDKDAITRVSTVLESRKTENIQETEYL